MKFSHPLDIFQHSSLYQLQEINKWWILNWSERLLITESLKLVESVCYWVCFLLQVCTAMWGTCILLIEYIIVAQIDFGIWTGHENAHFISVLRIDFRVNPCFQDSLSISSIAWLYEMLMWNEAVKTTAGSSNYFHEGYCWFVDRRERLVADLCEGVEFLGH